MEVSRIKGGGRGGGMEWREWIAEGSDSELFFVALFES